MNKILFVDDEESILTLLEESFTCFGYDIYTAKNGQEALEILRDNSISVIVTDIQMPTMNGLEFCRKVRQVNKISVIIAMTGFSSFFELTDCRAHGFDDYIRKPFTPKEVKSVVELGLEKVDRWKKLFNPHTFEGVL